MTGTQTQSATVTLDMNGREPRTMTLSDPRKSLVVEDWPYGRQAKTRATFEIESGRRGERVVRTLINPKTGQPCKPKKTTYYNRWFIVTGDDGKTYLVADCISHMSIFQGNAQFQEGTIWPDNGGNRSEGWARLVDLLKGATP